ncbi:organic hydroperoxide resistance protein [Populibacterium corticicola]|jgi:Ohr subfamily peroxiredoxin|uniref:Organic hydroperoxide resistance protein n=1 Tax=Populibacterium corticicola TaxID=1812826 RepID=A0ABW5XE01_9MICO
MSQPLYTTTATSWGGRDGRVATDDSKLDLALSVPSGLGGDDGPGTNPEQLFASAWAACFHGALKAVARQDKVELGDSAVTVTLSIGGEFNSGLNFTAKIQAELEGVDEGTAQDLINKAHEKCPYSRATRGNVDVMLETITSA